MEEKDSDKKQEIELKHKEFLINRRIVDRLVCKVADEDYDVDLDNQTVFENSISYEYNQQVC